MGNYTTKLHSRNVTAQANRAQRKKTTVAKKKQAAQARKNGGWFLKECNRNKRKQKKYRTGK